MGCFILSRKWQFNHVAGVIHNQFCIGLDKVTIKTYEPSNVISGATGVGNRW